jgi:hypothetical protein
VIPVDPDWQTVVTALYRRYGTYDKLLAAMGAQGCNPCDHAQLSRLRSGKCRRPTWQAGAALLNLYAQTPK